MIETKSIFSSPQFKASIIKAVEGPANLMSKDYNPVAAISFPLYSHYEYSCGSHRYNMHSGFILFEKEQIEFEVRKPKKPKDITLSISVFLDDFDLGIGGARKTEIRSRTPEIDYLSAQLLKTNCKLQKEDILLTMIDLSLNAKLVQDHRINSDHILRMDSSKQFIHENYNEEISISDIASAAFMSVFHFNRTFKQMIGYSPYQYLIAFRLGIAKKLLSEGMNVAETAFSVGFNSIENFSYTFRKHTGTSPSHYREQHPGIHWT